VHYGGDLQLSTKVRYGLRAILQIALQKEDTPVMTSLIAEEQMLSKKYLENLLNKLRIAGLIRSVRGSKGGYFLVKEPENITLEDIVIALDGPIALTQCVASNDSCEFTKDCAAHDLWSDMTDLFSDFLKTQTLKDLIYKHNKKKEV